MPLAAGVSEMLIAAMLPRLQAIRDAVRLNYFGAQRSGIGGTRRARVLGAK